MQSNSSRSELGRAFRKYLDMVIGLDNLNPVSLRKVDWKSPRYIEVCIDQPLGGDDMARIVTTAMSFGLEVDVRGVSSGYLMLRAAWSRNGRLCLSDDSLTRIAKVMVGD